MAALWSNAADEPLEAGEGDPLAELDLMMRTTDTPDPLATLAEYLRRPAWHADAACRGMGTDSFFVERGGDVKPAKALCAACPVKADCFASASANGDKHGIWGGLTAGKIRSAGHRAA